MFVKKSFAVIKRYIRWQAFGMVAILISTTCFAAPANTVVKQPSKSMKHGMGFLEYPKPNYGTGEQARTIARGEYLAKAADCIGCHTDLDNKDSKPFAGGRGISTPFGIIYSPNITPDPETGIGKWSDKDFIRAMQRGVSPKGEHYFPVFPYTSFTRVSKDDLLAIKAYLFSIPPVHQVKPENDMMWPFSWRFLQIGWKILFFYPHAGEYKYDAFRTLEWNRGAYLVQGLGHCAECHSPRNPLGGIKYRFLLTGGFVDNYYAPDITKSGLTGASTQQIMNVFTAEEMLKDAGRVEGPMEEVDHNSLRYLTKADLEAIAVYLQTVKSHHVKVAHKGPVTAEDGKKIYDTYCAACHASGGAGAPVTGDKAAWDPRMKQGMAVMNQHAINGYNSMPPKGTCMSCSDEEVKAAVTFMIDALSGGGVTSAIKPMPQPVRLSLADGKKIYDTNCGVCHNSGALGAPKLGDKPAWVPILKQNFDVVVNHTIQGYGRMPAKGACPDCSVAELIAAVKYMANESSNNDYSLW